MTDEFKTDALRYLLGELDAEARAAFEERLALDSAARNELKLCSDAVARFACETAPAESLPPPAQRSILSDVLTKIAQEPRRARSQWKRWRLLLPLAAAVAFGFWIARLLPTSAPSAKEAAKEQSTGRSPTVAMAPNHKSHGETSTSPTIVEKNVPSENAAVRDRIVEEAKQIERLRVEHAALERAHEELRARYAIMQRQLSLVGADGGRLTAIELVDSQSYERGEHKGLVDLARGLLTEPGIVAISPAIPTPAQTIPPTETTPPPSVPPPSEPGAATILTPPPPPPSPPQTPSAPPTTTAPEPYAWSVYDESAQRGYLNLYNLPATPADQTLQLWIKQPDAVLYQNVGTIPSQYYGGSGSVSYTLPTASQAPAEILITREPKGAVPASPTGKVLLRGP